MEKKFKHRKTGEIITYKDGVIKSGTLALDMGCEPSSEYWEKITEYPIGTKVKDILNNIERIKEPQGWRLKTHIEFTNIDESEIGEGKRFQVIEEPKKDYEIINLIKVKDKDTGKINDDINNINAWLKGYAQEYWKIYSIKRLSDGEIFKLEDEVKFYDTGYGKLLKIEFESAPADKGTGKLCFVNDNIHLGKWWDISQLSKAKPILFKSRDGFDIREGDKVYGISIDNWNVFSGVVQKDNRYHREEWKHGKFSTEEAAREYLMWNKPVLSLKDVTSIYPGINKNHNAPSHQAEQLKELAKSKL